MKTYSKAKPRTSNISNGSPTKLEVFRSCHEIEPFTGIFSDSDGEDSAADAEEENKGKVKKNKSKAKSKYFKGVSTIQKRSKGRSRTNTHDTKGSLKPAEELTKLTSNVQKKVSDWLKTIAGRKNRGRKRQAKHQDTDDSESSIEILRKEVEETAPGKQERLLPQHNITRRYSDLLQRRHHVSSATTVSSRRQETNKLFTEDKDWSSPEENDSLSSKEGQHPTPASPQPPEKMEVGVEDVPNLVVEEAVADISIIPPILDEHQQVDKQDTDSVPFKPRLNKYLNSTVLKGVSDAGLLDFPHDMSSIQCSPEEDGKRRKRQEERTPHKCNKFLEPGSPSKIPKYSKLRPKGIQPLNSTRLFQSGSVEVVDMVPDMSTIKSHTTEGRKSEQDGLLSSKKEDMPKVSQTEPASQTVTPVKLGPAATERVLTSTPAGQSGELQKKFMIDISSVPVQTSDEEELHFNRSPREVNSEEIVGLHDYSLDQTNHTPPVIHQDENRKVENMEVVAGPCEGISNGQTVSNSSVKVGYKESNIARNYKGKVSVGRFDIKTGKSNGETVSNSSVKIGDKESNTAHRYKGKVSVGRFDSETDECTDIDKQVLSVSDYDDQNKTTGIRDGEEKTNQNCNEKENQEQSCILNGKSYFHGRVSYPHKEHSTSFHLFKYHAASVDKSTQCSVVKPAKFKSRTSSERSKKNKIEVCAILRYHGRRQKGAPKLHCIVPVRKYEAQNAKPDVICSW